MSVSNPNPENPGVLQSAFKQNGKAGDLVSAVPPCGEPLGLKLKQHENPQFSEAILTVIRSIRTQTRPYLNENVGVEGTAFAVAGED